MFLNFFPLALFLLTTSSSHGALLQFEKLYLYSSASRVLLNEIYPPGLKRIVFEDKPPMMFGYPSAATSTLIDEVEAFPVENKINYIENLQRSKGRFFPLSLPRNMQAQHMFLSRFIDVRVLRLLIRIAGNRRREEEQSVHSACDVIRFVQHKYPQVRFEYLTPQYIIDWYNVLGHTIAINSVWGVDALSDEVRYADTDEPLLVFLGRAHWDEYFLEPRRNRYTLTGYDLPL